MEDKNLVKRVAELGNMNVMILFLLVALIALSVGLAFFFLVPGAVGYGIGITMFVVAGLLFVVGRNQLFFQDEENPNRMIKLNCNKKAALGVRTAFCC